MSLSESTARKRLLVFGATGSFGCIVAECLAREQVQVTAWVRPETLLGKKERLGKLRSAGVEIFQGDFGSRSQLLTALTGVHTVVSCLSGSLTLPLRWLLCTIQGLARCILFSEQSFRRRCCIEAATGSAGACQSCWSAEICAFRIWQQPRDGSE